MILRRWLPLLLCLLLLAGCASTESLPPPAENDPLSKAPPVKGAVTLYTYDGGRVNAQWITDSGKSAALVAALSAVNAPRTGKWTSNLVELPVYAAEFQGRDGQMIRGAWSNGCWITGEGTAYRFDFDFDALRADRSWQERESGCSLAAPPCAYALTRCPNSWRGDLLPLSAELRAEDGVALTAASYGDGLLHVWLRNELEETYCYGKFSGTVSIGRSLPRPSWLLMTSPTPCPPVRRRRLSLTPPTTAICPPGTIAWCSPASISPGSSIFEKEPAPSAAGSFFT